MKKPKQCSGQTQAERTPATELALWLGCQELLYLRPVVALHFDGVFAHGGAGGAKFPERFQRGIVIAGHVAEHRDDFAAPLLEGEGKAAIAGARYGEGRGEELGMGRRCRGSFLGGLGEMRLQAIECGKGRLGKRGGIAACV